MPKHTFCCIPFSTTHINHGSVDATLVNCLFCGSLVFLCGIVNMTAQEVPQYARRRGWPPLYQLGPRVPMNAHIEPACDYGSIAPHESCQLPNYAAVSGHFHQEPAEVTKRLPDITRYSRQRLPHRMGDRRKKRLLFPTINFHSVAGCVELALNIKRATKPHAFQKAVFLEHLAFSSTTNFEHEAFGVVLHLPKVCKSATSKRHDRETQSIS